MADLLVKPSGNAGKVHDITPESASWGYVGFGLYHLKVGESAAEDTGDKEVILVLVEGKAEISGSGQDFGELGDRMNVFERKKAAFLVSISRTDLTGLRKPRPIAFWQCVQLLAKATTRPGSSRTSDWWSAARAVTPAIFTRSPWKKATLPTVFWSRKCSHPQGNWSSYPPHRHDEENFPDMTYLEETYYHRLNPKQGFGFQRVFTEDGELDETMAVSDGDVVLVPKGHHPCGAPYGYEMYYLNVMAGPMRKWRFQNHPDHDWIAQRDAD